jgi:TP901 family phage tail tape measure protein
MKQSHGALSATEAHTKAMQAQRNELAALDNAFTAISNQYGVQKKDVDEVAGAWAAAGASGIRLAKSVNLTMQAMIIGDMDAATATQSLISIQAQYNLNSKQLASTLAMLNNVENQTGISMSGLIDGFTRAAGVARAAGVSTKELAAELAALVPATGSAANAGNALKTIYSRLMAPTSDSMDIMKAMGLEIKTTAWQSANAADRLKLMQKAFENWVRLQRTLPRLSSRRAGRSTSLKS